MNQEQSSRDLQELADYYDKTDTSDLLAQATWEESDVADPMVTTSVRLPKALLDRIREVASSEHLKTSAFIRKILEESVASRSDEGSLGELGRLVQSMSRAGVEVNVVVGSPGNEHRSSQELEVRRARVGLYSRAEIVSGDVRLKRSKPGRRASRATTRFIAGTHRHVSDGQRAG